MRSYFPHVGYHWDSTTKHYFEGWYLRLTLPKIEQTFAFMYSIQDPIGGQKNSGGAVQVLGIDETYICRTFPDVNKFFAAKDSFTFGHWGRTNREILPQLLSPEEFNNYITEGYQVNHNLNQGKIYDPVSNSYCCWEYEIKPVYSWGNNQATAGNLSYLPIFEPGWQITMAHGLATGWIIWQGQKYQFHNAPAYSEKNWGSSFPQQWFWLNCNSFSDRENLALTAGGGIRKALWWTEEVALIGIHYQGNFYEFAPWNSQINWEAKSWGKWQLQAANKDYQVEIVGRTNLLGTYVRTPTDRGLIFNCRDTTKGHLKLVLESLSGKKVLEAESDLAGLEIGGY